MRVPMSNITWPRFESAYSEPTMVRLCEVGLPGQVGVAEAEA